MLSPRETHPTGREGDFEAFGLGEAQPALICYTRSKLMPLPMFGREAGAHSVLTSRLVRGKNRGLGEKIELSFDVSPQFDKTLNELAQKIGGDKPDLFRKAIALIQVAIEAEEQGKSLCIAGKDERIETKIVGLSQKGRNS